MIFIESGAKAKTDNVRLSSTAIFFERFFMRGRDLRSKLG